MCTSFGCAISPRPADEFSVPSNISWSTEERAQGSRFEPRALSQSRHCSHRKDVAINACQVTKQIPRCRTHFLSEREKHA